MISLAFGRRRASSPASLPTTRGVARVASRIVLAGALALPVVALADAPAVAPADAAAAAEPPRDLSAYKEEQVSGGALAAGAYMVMWVLVAAFVGRVAMAQARTEAALRDLEDRVDASHGARPAATEAP